MYSLLTCLFGSKCSRSTCRRELRHNLDQYGVFEELCVFDESVGVHNIDGFFFYYNFLLMLLVENISYYKSLSIYYLLFIFRHLYEVLTYDRSF